jgi:hypothetical protein
LYMPMGSSTSSQVYSPRDTSSIYSAPPPSRPVPPPGAQNDSPRSAHQRGLSSCQLLYSHEC